MSDDGRYYGKYRGTVVSNVDPESRGRIQAMVPDVLGLTPSTYALPCMPIAGKQSGVFVVPELGATVWIEFEQGDPDYPIWTGCFWGSTAVVPAMGLASTPASPNIVLQTSVTQASLVLMGAPTPGVTLSAGPLGPSPSITMTPVAIVIKCGASTITLNAAGVAIVGPIVSLNGAALQVTGP